MSSRIAKEKGGINERLVFNFSKVKCKKCPLKSKCLKTGAKSKSRSIRILSETHEDYMKFENSAFFDEKYKLRYMIEAKNADGSYTSATVNVLVASQAIQADGFDAATTALNSGFAANPWAA